MPCETWMLIELSTSLSLQDAIASVSMLDPTNKHVHSTQQPNTTEWRRSTGTKSWGIHGTFHNLLARRTTVIAELVTYPSW